MPHEETFTRINIFTNRAKHKTYVTSKYCDLKSRGSLEINENYLVITKKVDDISKTSLVSKYRKHFYNSFFIHFYYGICFYNGIKNFLFEICKYNFIFSLECYFYRQKTRHIGFLTNFEFPSHLLGEPSRLGTID